MDEEKFVFSNISQMAEKFGFDLVNEFITHFEALLESIDQLVLDLQNPELFHEHINEIFRVFHTLKSSSGFFHLERMHKLCTLVEEVLEEARTIQYGEANPEFIDWLFSATDQLKFWLEDLQNDRDLVPCNPAIMRIPIAFVIEERKKLRKRKSQKNPRTGISGK